MGGWFNREITSLEHFKGLRYRMAGPGAEVLRRFGATVVLLPGSEILSSLRSGAIDACEWIGPWLDTAMGLQNVATYYYYPAWHEPGTSQMLGINRQVWERLDASDRRLIEVAAANEYALSLAEFTSNNARALRELRKNSKIGIARFDEAMLKAFADMSKDVVAQIGSTDPLSRKIYDSYHQFRGLIAEWTDISEAAYLGIRGLGLG